MSKHNFPHLLKPLVLNGGAVTLRNRVLMGSMHTGLEEPGLLNKNLDEMAAYFGERAKGGVGLIVTGGIAPNNAGRGFYMASKLTNKSEVKPHRVVPQAVHEHGGKIAMQILHTGRYAYHHWAVAPSALKSPIGWFTPHAMSTKEVYSTIDDFVRCAELAKEAGYDGVEIMGSEGYLINQFIVSKTNKRTDEFGGSYENRIRLPLEIVRRTRQALGNDFIIIYRLSMLDLVNDGSNWDEVAMLAKKIEEAGASIINTGIGWHEARVPTIATLVPRGGFSWVTKKLKPHVDIPLCTTNRINMPAIAEQILADGCADMVSMARPFLADPYLVQKAAEGRVDEINTCIGCNQACLDHIFVNKRASCLVNPRAGYEAELKITPVAPGQRKKVAVIGAGPAGLACAATAAERGHDVTLFEKDSVVGGQFNMAKKVPGKEEFYETIRYFETQLRLQGVNVRLNTEATEEMLLQGGFDSFVVASGVLPRQVRIPGIDHPKVVGYVDVLRHNVPIGERVAIVGAGGIGFDIAEFLTHRHHSDLEGPSPVVDQEGIQAFASEWGVDLTNSTRGGLLKREDKVKSPRTIYLLQRTAGKLGAGLGKTTGWIHRASLKNREVNMIGGVKYVGIDDRGLTIEVKGKQQLLEVDNVVLCAGQESLKNLVAPLQASGKPVFLIGGAELAAELDAKRAIDQGTRLAATIETAQSGQVFNQPVTMGYQIAQQLRAFVPK